VLIGRGPQPAQLPAIRQTARLRWVRNPAFGRVKAARGFGELPVTGQLLLKGDTHDGVPEVTAQYEAEAGPVPAASDFADLYERHFTGIHRYIAGRLGRDLADDIAADTFVIALRKRDGFDASRGTMRAWLYGIATNLVARQRRAERRRYRALARAGARDLADAYEERVVSWVAAERLQPRIATALARLSREERDVLLLVALADFSHEEISQALGIPYGTVGSRLSRARKKIRTTLGQEGQIDE
jgi:RNA polymerase sigma-70 factor (ECF subfamily)